MAMKLLFSSAAAAVVCASGFCAPCGQVHRPEFVLPDTLYAAPGIECNVYFAGALDSVRPYQYAFEARADVGKCENERWTWTPKAADAGRREQVVFNAWSDDGLACCRTVTVEVASAKADPSRHVTCALLGDSLTNARYQDRILVAMHEAGWKGYEAVGSRSGSSAAPIGEKKDGEAPHDGYGGYTPGSFLTTYALSVDELDNIQSEQEREQLKSFGAKLAPGQEWRKGLLKSPIVRIKDGKKTVDVQAWFDQVNGGKAPDFVFICLGGNGTCIQRDETVVGYCERGQVEPMRKLIEHLRAAAPDTKICIGTCPVGVYDQDAFGKGYGCSISAVQCRKNLHFVNRCWMDLVKEFNDRGDDKVFVAPVAQAIDPVRGYPTREVKPFVHSTEKVVQGCNALHATMEGGKQLGDAFAAWLLCHM